MSRRTPRIIAASAVALLGVGGYFAYSLFAAQGQGDLAQAPLNNTTAIPPAFIMAVDDSNSMTFERIFKGGWSHAVDGQQFLQLGGCVLQRR